MTQELKKQFNIALKRWRKAEELDKQLKLNESHLPELLKIHQEIYQLLDAIGEYTESESMDGFEGV